MSIARSLLAPLSCLALAIVAALALAGCSDTTARPSTQKTHARDADLRELRRWMSTEQSFTTHARTTGQKFLNELDETAATMSEAEFYMAVRQLAAFANNAHSAVSNRAVYERLGLVPVRMYWFADGPWIVRARAEHANLVGAQITAINGRPVADVAESLLEYHSGSPEFFRRFTGPTLMLSPPVLHAAGLGDSSEELTLELTDTAGRPSAVTLANEVPPVAAPANPLWRILLAARSEGEGWAQARPSGAPEPFYLRDAADPFRFTWLGTDIAYVQLRANIGRPGNTIRDFTDGVRRQLDERAARAVVLDNRLNGGGDLTRTADFALELPDLVTDGGPVYVLTDHATFSAGIYTSFYPKSAAPDRTTVVGLKVGDFTRFWAESREYFRLPQSGIGIGSSLQMHDIGIGCNDRRICHLAGRDRLNIAVGSLDPDVEIGLTYADYVAGRDPVLDWVLEDLGSR